MARIDFPSNPSNGQTLTVTVAGANTVYTYNSTYGVLVGGGNWDGAGSYSDAYYEDLRITKGLARYTSNFTPPTAALKG